jgi:hypothetical protein
VAKKPSKIEVLQTKLAKLQASIPEDLRLRSLSENKLEGYAALFCIVLPLLDAMGNDVYTEAMLEEIFVILDRRFGGCLAPSSRSHPPFWGLWHPPDGNSTQGEKDYLTTIQVFASPIDSSSRFFKGLKEILKTGGHVAQQEILISRIDCWLM